MLTDFEKVRNWSEYDFEVPAQEIKKLSDRWLLIDYGEVISTAMSNRNISEMAILADQDQSEFLHRYWDFRRSYDLGQSRHEYWSAVLGKELLANSVLVEDLDQIDVASWADTNAEMLTLLEKLAIESSLRLGLLSNAPESIAANIESSEWAKIFDQRLFSCHLGLAKPDPRIFKIAMKALGVEAGSILFVDDRIENTMIASSLGIDALHFTSCEDLCVRLRQWL